jgi:hypothetical protein
VIRLLIFQALALLAIAVLALLRERKTGRSALYRGALAVSRWLRWLAALVAAVFTVIDELELFAKISDELRIQLAQDSFESAEVKEFRFR